MAVTADTLRLQERIRRDLEKITNAQTRDLVRAWADAWTEVQPDLTAALLEQLTAGEGVTRAQMLRSTRLRKALQVIAAQLKDLAGAAGVRITADLQSVIDTAGAAQASVIDSQLPPNAPQLVSLDEWSRVDGRQVAAIVKRSTEQITARSRPLASEAYDIVRRELIRGVASGSNPRLTAARMVRRAERYGFNGGLTRALTIARTETLSAHREAARLGREPHADVLGGWKWMCSLSARTCPACLSRHGTLHAVAESGPDGHPNCRCAAVPVTKSWADLGFDIEEPADLFPDARTWFASQSEATQVAIMGRQRLDMLNAGEVGWTDMATLRRNPDWRSSWQVTPVKTLARKAAAA